MILVAVLLLLGALAVAELWSIAAVAGLIGVGPTILLLVGAAVLGVFVVRRAGLSAMRRANAEMASGRMPTAALIDGALVLIAGCCLIVPGFVTDLIGLVLLLGPIRTILRGATERWLERRVATVGMVDSVRIGGLGDAFPGGAVWGGGGGGWTDGSGWNGTWIDADGTVRPDRDGVVEATAEVIDIEVHRPLELDPPET